MTRPQVPEEFDDAPDRKGAYLLLLRLDDPLSFRWRHQRVRLHTGWYVYAGNAHGPGGIGARLRHHLRRGKKVHWHIDHLTNAAAQIRTFAVIRGAECSLVARLLASLRFSVPLAGFGSSDCRVCPAHLLRWEFQSRKVRRHHTVAARPASKRARRVSDGSSPNISR